MVGFGFILFGHYELWHVFSAKSFNIPDYVSCSVTLDLAIRAA
jgi:hypothetical protein